MIRFAENLNKMIAAGLGGALEAPRTEVAVGHCIRYLEASGPVASFESNIAAPIRNLRVDMHPIQAGSGDPSPDNIRPITGRDGVTVWRTGKNLFDGEWESGAISNKTGENISDSASANIRCKNYIPCKNGQSIYMGWDTTASGSVYMLVMTYGADGSYKRYAGAKTNPYTLKLNDDEHFIRFFLYNRTEQLVNPYIVYGSTATDYEPYDGQSVTVQLGQTVYGGTLDVITGVLTVEWENIASYDGEALPGEWISDRDAYAPGTTPTTGAQVCYKLATPITIDLTSAQLTTLKGQNNVWSDAGDVTLEYPYYEETEGY